MASLLPWLPPAITLVIGIISILTTRRIHRDKTRQDDERERRQALASEAQRRSQYYERLVVGPLEDLIKQFIDASEEQVTAGLARINEAARSGDWLQITAAVREANLGVQRMLRGFRFKFLIGVAAFRDPELRDRLRDAFRMIEDGMARIFDDWLKDTSLPLTPDLFYEVFGSHANLLAEIVTLYDPTLRHWASHPPPGQPGRSVASVPPRLLGDPGRGKAGNE